MITFPDDMFKGEPNHPICVFFEAFPATPDPDDDYYSLFACHMAMGTDHANVCKGDYLKCPIAYGRAKVILDNGGRIEKG